MVWLYRFVHGVLSAASGRYVLVPGDEHCLSYCYTVLVLLCVRWSTVNMACFLFVYTVTQKKWELLKCVVASMYSWQHCGTGTLSYR